MATDDTVAVIGAGMAGLAAAVRLAAQKALSYSPEPAEKALIDALAAAAPRATAAGCSLIDLSGALPAEQAGRLLPSDPTDRDGA